MASHVYFRKRASNTNGVYYHNDWHNRGICFVLFLTFRISFVGLCWATKPELIIEPVGVIKQGDRVTIKCRIPAEGPFDIAKIVRKLWNNEYTLSKKGNVELFYRRTGRYMVTHFDPRAGEVDLTIRGKIN